MENTSSAASEQLAALLAQRVEDQRADLADRYLNVLREALFSSRAEMRPSALKQIAADEVEALLHFLRQANFSAAKRGEQLHQAGFKAGAVLRLSQVTRQFLLDGLENHHIASVLEIADAYERAVVEGFVQSIDDTNQIERGQLERVLNALHQRGDN
ncbi:MAG: hypothetical protein WCC12_07780 [Anaerolineales bacterium]